MYIAILTCEAIRQIGSLIASRLHRLEPAARKPSIPASDAGHPGETALDAKFGEHVHRPTLVIRVMVVAVSLVAAIAHLASTPAESESPKTTVVTASDIAPAAAAVPDAVMAKRRAD